MTRFALVPASYVFLLRPGEGADEVLLHLRRGTGYRDGSWACLAGHVDPDETARAAAAREVREEAGVVVAEPDLTPLTAVHRMTPGAGPVEQRVDFFWSARRWTGDPVVQEPAKNGGLRWFPVDRLPAATVPQEAHVLGLLAAHRPVPPILCL